MSICDELGKRMKSNYEEVTRTKLVRRMPVIIRIDGKSFRTFTKNFRKPFDKIVVRAMQETTRYLCENIQGCVLGYTQSDEISLVLVDYKNLNSDAWFNNEVQKICSIAASMATMKFNAVFRDYVTEYVYRSDNQNEEEQELCKAYKKAVYVGALFDARCFNIPKEEVTNYIYWRQTDAIRNSVLTLGRSYFDTTELNNKSISMVKQMLIEQKDIDWKELPIHLKRGTCVIKYKSEQLNFWQIDRAIPIFKSDNRLYIDKLIYF